MASRRDLLSAQRIRWASKQRDQGTLCSLGYSAAVRSDPSQESGLEVLRKNDQDETHALKAFHGFKRAVRIESLNRDTRLSQQKRHVHIPSGITARTRLTGGVTGLSASSAIEGPKATPRSRTPSESYTNRAASKTSSIFTCGPFSRADVWSGGS